MSLNREQRRITSEELKAHFHESKLTIDDIADEMNISTKEVKHVLDMKAPNGLLNNQLQRFIHLVWDVRDLINRQIRELGREPEEYTFLKGEKEDYWFLQ